MSLGRFVQYSIVVPPSSYFGIDGSVSQAYYTAGAVQYWVFEPSSAAIAAAGWSGLPYRVLHCWGTLTSAITGLGVDEGKQMTDDANIVAGKLGFGTARDGSLAVPNQLWPTLCVFHQKATAWTPAISGAANRADMHIAATVMADVATKYAIDTKHIYGCGVSGGGTQLLQAAIGQFVWPASFPLKYAAVLTSGIGLSGSKWRQDMPEAIQGEDSTAVTVPRICGWLAAMKLPIWMNHSQNDAQSTPVIYHVLSVPLGNVLPYSVDVAIPVGGGAWSGLFRTAGPYIRYTEYTPASTGPSHQQTWDAAFGNNTIGGSMLQTDPLWVWLLGQGLSSGSNPNATTFLRYALVGSRTRQRRRR